MRAIYGFLCTFLQICEAIYAYRNGCSGKQNHDFSSRARKTLECLVGGGRGGMKVAMDNILQESEVYLSGKDIV